jgi:hypothetical protein
MGNAMGKSKCLTYVQILYTHVGAFYRSEQSTNTMVRNMIMVCWGTLAQIMKPLEILDWKLEACFGRCVGQPTFLLLLPNR